MAFVPPHAHIHKEKTKHVSYKSRYCSRLMAWTPQRQIEHLEVLDTVTGVTSGRVYQGKALGCMLVAHPLRSTFISIVEHGSFDRAVLFLILANSVTMALRDPLAEELPQWAPTLEWIFTVLFSIEGVCKIFALGLLFDTRTAYLHDAWNWLDALTVLVSWMSLLLPDAGNLSAIRSVRVLKPLRTVQRVPGLRMLIGALLHSLPMMGDVANLFAFFLVAFGVVGVELFGGTLHYRCYDDVTGEIAEATHICASTDAMRDTLASGGAGSDAMCPSNHTCRYTEINPNYGATSYDHIFSSMVNIFQVRNRFYCSGEPVGWLAPDGGCIHRLGCRRCRTLADAGATAATE